MKYRVLFTGKSKKQLTKLDKSVSTILLKWIYANLDGTTDSRVHGKGLVSNRSNQWRYRVGKYRIICNIKDQEVLIEVVKIGLRNNVYQEKQ